LLFSERKIVFKSKNVIKALQVIIYCSYINTLLALIKF